MLKLTHINKQFSILEIQSNKYYKLKYNFLQAKKQQCNTLVTFGGAFSNHIAAVAYFGKKQGFTTIGIIRGEELANDLEKILATNVTLRKAHQNGMQFIFVSREMYKNKKQPDFLEQFNIKENYYVLPEGGTNRLAIKGCEKILNEQTNVFDIVCVPVGTGGTISGIINSAKSHQKIIGYSALKGDFLNDEIKKYTINQDNWSLNTDYHFGGYAKVTDDLITFINEFKTKYDVLLDPIYTAKMVFGIDEQLDKKLKNKRVLAIHTGGYQGIEAMNLRLKKKNKQHIHL